MLLRAMTALRGQDPLFEAKVKFTTRHLVLDHCGTGTCKETFTFTGLGTKWV